METVNYKTATNPPDGLLIWIVICLELLTFGLGFVALAYYGSVERDVFHEGSLQLNKTLATVNTILLLVGGYFAARGVRDFQAGLYDKVSKQFLWAILCGVGFLLVKGFEYYTKIEAGLGMDGNTFFVFYWLLTGFHWIHVLVGIVILLVLRRIVIKRQGEAKFEDIDAGVAFWHMCDIIWLLLFPILYLLF